jgi:hypothetical protein
MQSSLVSSGDPQEIIEVFDPRDAVVSGPENSAMGRLVQ